MTATFGRRPEDKTARAIAAHTVKETSRTFWNWVEYHHFDSLAVILVTLVLTVRVVEWAFDFSYDMETKLGGTDKAAIIAAVMTPWGLMQAALVKWYMELKGKTNGPGKA